jgi:hypothetical protein
MSFRWFIYYCAACAACGAYLGWALGRWVPFTDPVARNGVKGLLLGLLLAVGLGIVDALNNVSPNRAVGLALGVLIGGLIGAVGGFLGGAVSQILLNRIPSVLVGVVVQAAGWTFTGLLIGAAPGLFELLRRLFFSEATRGATKKTINGIVGGALGGLVGSVLYLALNGVLSLLLRDQADVFWTPAAVGFVVLGLCIGLLVGLAQVILKEAWIKVESGFRPGRELILSREETVIGRAESCDLGLFGDRGVEKQHARILLEKGRYVLRDDDTPGGTFLNGERIDGPTPLRSGDLIRVGQSTLRFGERQKQPEE